LAGIDRAAAIERLDDATSRRLLLPHEPVRDPVHGDIWITALERALIDTAPLQRLRAIQQLGPTSMVYPGAVHTRFIHSLGTLHVAEQLVETVNRNYKIYSHAERGLVKIDPYCHVLIRLCALLHDVAHIPFGHTLEDEGNLAPPEWEDDQRASGLLGDDPASSVVPALRSFLRAAGVSDEATETLVNDLGSYLLHKGDAFELEHPYVVDLISNTLCADLLDYVDRDSYFCGLRERSGDRVVKHVGVLRLRRAPTARDGHMEYLVSTESEEGKGRVVLLTYRFEHDHVDDQQFKIVQKPEILSEAIDLLRRRFALAQKVYFHRTKLAASAMLIEAVSSSSIKLDELYGLTDAEFIQRLAADDDPVTRRLIDAYRVRRLYRPVYQLRFMPENDDDWRARKLWGERYDTFRDPVWRRREARYLEDVSGLPAGSCIIYCPDRQMNMKEFDMLVQSWAGGTVKALKDTLDATRKMEMDAINNRFSDLWSVQVFVDPQRLDVSKRAEPRAQDLSALCERVAGFENDIEELAGKGRKPEEQMVAAARKELEAESPMPEEVEQSMLRGVEGMGSADVYEDLKDRLRSEPTRQPGP